MFLLVSVLAENWLQIRRTLLQGGRPPSGTVGSRTALPPEVLAGMGGRLLLLDWDAGRITHHWPCASPVDVSWAPDEPRLWVASGRAGVITELDSRTWTVTRTISHPGFHDLHTITRHGERLLVSAAGTDAVFSLDLDGGLHRGWWGTSHGLDRTPAGGQRFVDPSADHRGAAYPSLARAIHPNGALGLANGHWRVTSFHLGGVLDVAPDGDWSLWASGLDHPHGLTRLPPGAVPGAAWLIADTLRGRVVALSADGAAAGTLAAGLRWVQDATWTPQGLVVVDALHVGPGRRPTQGNCVLAPDTGVRCTLPASWRPVSVRPLTPAQAQACQRWPAFPSDGPQRWSGLAGQ